MKIQTHCRCPDFLGILFLGILFLACGIAAFMQNYTGTSPFYLHHIQIFQHMISIFVFCIWWLLILHNLKIIEKLFHSIFP